MKIAWLEVQGACCSLRLNFQSWELSSATVFSLVAVLIKYLWTLTLNKYFCSGVEEFPRKMKIAFSLSLFTYTRCEASENKHVSKTLFPLYPHMMQFKIFPFLLCTLARKTTTKKLFLFFLSNEKIINGNFKIIAPTFSYFLILPFHSKIQFFHNFRKFVLFLQFKFSCFSSSESTSWINKTIGLFKLLSRFFPLSCTKCF